MVTENGGGFMIKKITAVIFFILLFTSAVWADTIERYQGKSQFNDSTVYFDIFNFQGTNYFSLRDISALLNDTEASFSFEFNSENNNVVINKNAKYAMTGNEFNKSIGKKKTTKKSGILNVKSDNTDYTLKVYNINNRNYIALRDICQILDLNTKWEANTKTIELWYYNDMGEEINVCSIAVLPPVIVDKNKPMVALTFDDGPSANTDRILDTLEKYNGVATFFVTGYNASKYSDTLKRIVDEESQIGNHTYGHLRLTELSADEIKYQVNCVQEIVKNAAGVYPTVVRPPYGSYNDFVKANINLKMLNWNVDTLDWKTRNANSTYDEVINTLADGNVILMHDLYSQTAEAVEKIVPEIINRGYQLVTVDQLCYAKGKIKGQIK